MKIAILGSHPALSLAELESLYGSAVRPLHTGAALLDHDQVALSRLGGAIKLAELQASLPTGNWPDISQALMEASWLEPYLTKRDIGLSLYGHKLPDDQLFRLGLELKRAWRQRGYKLRLLRSTGGVLSAAQIIHQQAVDVVVVVDQTTTYLGITQAIQDIEAYAKRDYHRPARDARVGMLPPKLAQMMINLAQPDDGQAVYDPFCGTGVVLQEALLMGYPAAGSDIDPRMVALSQQNLAWLGQDHSLPAYTLSQADATLATLPLQAGVIVTEGYLGPPLTAVPNTAALARLHKDINQLYERLLTNLARQTPQGTRLVIGLPAWRQAAGQAKFSRPTVIDQIRDFGYTNMVFRSAPDGRFLYSRPNQVVGRQILALQRM